MAKRFFAFAILLAVTGCQKLPDTQWNRLQELRTEIRKDGLTPYLPDKIAQFESSFERTRREYAVQSNRNALFRKTSELQERISRQIRQAEQLKQEASATKERLREMERDALDSLETAAEAWGDQTLNPAHHEMIAAIELGINESRSVWSQGDYLRAQELLERIEAQATAFQQHFEGLQSRFKDPESRSRWNTWALRTVQWSKEKKKPALLVDKYNRRALLYESGEKVAEYTADLGWNRFPAKIQQGDGATPEGMYRVVRKKGAGQTIYFRALLLNYPNDADQKAFRAAKRQGDVERRARIGAQIEVHGDGGRGRDWTQGCVALANREMENVFKLAYVGMPVTIVGELPE